MSTPISTVSNFGTGPRACRVWGFSDCPVCGRPPSQQQSSFLPWGRRQGSYHLFRDKRSAIAFDHNRLCQVCQDIKAKIESIR